MNFHSYLAQAARDMRAPAQAIQPLRERLAILRVELKSAMEHKRAALEGSIIELETLIRDLESGNVPRRS